MSNYSPQDDTAAESVSPSPEKKYAGDTRGRAYGWGRVVIGFFWFWAVGVTGLAVYDIVKTPSLSPFGPYALEIVAAFTYVVVALALTHNGRRMRMLGTTGLVAAIVAPLSVGLASIGAGFFPHPDIYSAWENFGAAFFYLPIPVALVGLLWMWLSNPRRIVSLQNG